MGFHFPSSTKQFLSAIDSDSNEAKVRWFRWVWCCCSVLVEKIYLHDMPSFLFVEWWYYSTDIIEFWVVGFMPPSNRWSFERFRYYSIKIVSHIKGKVFTWCSFYRWYERTRFSRYYEIITIYNNEKRCSYSSVPYVSSVIKLLEFSVV
jgi:hypothetical protein